ncbi:conserved hypothetical protein [Desulfovibrionales bacterium]
MRANNLISEQLVEFEAHKRVIYERIPQWRRKFVDRIGYDNWDPFQQPNNPIEIRRDRTQCTMQDLVAKFLCSRSDCNGYGTAYVKGVIECALGIINRQERILGIYEFSLWYHELLKKEGYGHDLGAN